LVSDPCLIEEELNSPEEIAVSSRKENIASISEGTVL